MYQQSPFIEYLQKQAGFRDSVTAGFGRVKNTLKNLFGRAAQEAPPPPPPTRMEQAKAYAQNVYNTGRDYAGAVYSRLQEQLGGAAGKVKDTAGNAAAATKEYAGRAGSHIKDNAAAYGAGAVGAGLGGYGAYEASEGNPYATAAGVVGGAATAGAGAHYAPAVYELLKKRLGR